MVLIPNFIINITFCYLILSYFTEQKLDVPYCGYFYNNLYINLPFCVLSQPQDTGHCSFNKSNVNNVKL